MAGKQSGSKSSGSASSRRGNRTDADADAEPDADADADVEVRPVGVAIFDLDRTLLRGSSGEVFSEAMRLAGLVSRNVPGEKYLFALFNTVGETLPSMALARQAARLSKGRSQAVVQRAADEVSDRLVSMVQPFAASLFAEHRAAGRKLVLATTTPYDLVKPFADRLGLDAVVATRYGVGSDGDTYDGTIDGPFVWSTGKLEAVRSWADEHGIDLGSSWFYSDSVYDTPLMSVVGNPVVVNPDPRMMVMAAAQRWPTLHLDVSPGVVKVPVIGVELQRLAMAFARPSLIPYADIQITGVDRIPEHGPAILVANHRSYFDSAVMAMVVARSGRTIRFLGKKEVFDVPVFGAIAKAMGGIRVDRGSGSDEPLQAAVEALAGGELVGLMPQGTIPRGPAFFDPELAGRFGAARLAQLTGAPVIPIGLWGTERVWPRSSRVPKVFNITDAPTVTATVGKPVKLKHQDLATDTAKIMKAIVKLLPDEARRHHKPTDTELAATYPHGHQPG